VLALFASAIAGRPVPLEFTANARGGSDGSTIYVPATLDPGSLEARRLVICLAALQGSRTYRKDLLRKLSRGGAEVSRRYLLLEVWRSCSRLESMLPRSFNAALHEVTASLSPSASATESLRRAKSTETLPPLPSWFGDLVPSRVLSAGNVTPGGTPSDDDASLAAQLAPEEDTEDDESEIGDRSRIMELLSAPMRNRIGEGLQKLLGMGRSTAEGSAGEEIPVIGARRSGANSAKGRLVPGANQPRIEMAGQLVLGASYPEWDNERSRYREEWTRVGEFDPAVVDGIEPPAAHGNRTLMRALARLALAWDTHRGEAVGDNLDLTALVDFHVSVATGHGGEARVYTAHRRTSQRLGVLILLDATGSTAETSSGEIIFAAQRDLAFEMTSALEQLGVRTATYGFYSQGRHNVRFLHAKSFDEPWSAAAQRRLLSIGPSGFTRLGAAIRHATSIIALRAGTDHQLVVVIGDGVVFDHGYEGRYATEDSRVAIEEAAARGVAIVGLSVCPTPDESLWPPSQHRVVRDAEELAPQTRSLFGGALGRARRAQRPNASQRSVYVGTEV
jgi:nitric oxide reductase NorD protein